MYPIIVLFVVVLNLYCNNFVNSVSQYPVIFIISYDAFRYNYIERGITPNLAKLRNEGSYAFYMDNVFITKTYPNHHSIATGLYPEIHGVVGNNFYDPVLKKQLQYSYEMWHYSDSVVPIWIVNEKKGGGRHSGVMMWPGNEYEYGGIRPTYSRPWDANVAYSARVDQAIKWIEDPKKPANLVLMYIEEPDGGMHAFGPDSEEGTAKLKSVDNLTHYILKQLEIKNLTDVVNLFFLSDHGMESVTAKDIIDFRPYVDETAYDIYENSPVLHIYPKPGKATTVYEGLQKAVKELGHFKVYKQAEIPERWRYKNNVRIPPILVVADPPYVFHDFYATIKYEEKKFNFTADDKSKFGVHGYDNAVPNMKPYFVAKGPALGVNNKVSPFKTVDLFSLWAHMAGFPEYAERTNGCLSRVQAILRGDNPSVVTANVPAVILGVLAVGGTMAVAVYFINKKLRLRHRDYCDRLVGDVAESRQRLLESQDLEEDT